jgi:CBS-domain-containing membrane protein
MRSPFTGVVFALELTHDVNILLPLLVAVTIAHGFTVLLLGRSILTEKVARRGFHMSREYAVDPLEILFAREVMQPNVVALRLDADFETHVAALHVDPEKGPQRLYPIVDADGRLTGVVTRVDLQKLVDRARTGTADALESVVRRGATVAYPAEPLRVVVQRMAETGLTHFPVVDPETSRVVGMVGLDDLLKARARNLDAERRRERVLDVRLLFPLAFRRT